MTRLLMTADAVGGVWQYANDLGAALEGFGFETVIAAMGPPPTLEQRRAVAALPGVTLIDTGLPLDWLAADRAAMQNAADRIARLARETGADIVQLNTPALAALAEFEVPVVAVAHGCLASWWEVSGEDALPADYAWRAELMRAGLLAADRVIAPSNAFAEATRRVHDLPRLPEVVHNGRAALALPPAAMHDFAFTAARLWDRAKGIRTLDRAAALLGVPVKAAGPLSGPHGERITLENIRPLGTLGPDALGRCLAARPVFVSAAEYEPFGLAVLEAAQAGCALVLSDIPSFRELWDGAAEFVPPGDHLGFASAIDTLIGDLSQRLASGLRARRIAARYSPRAMAAGMATIYRGLVPARVAA